MNIYSIFLYFPPHDGPVIRLSLGKLLVNLLQVVKRTNTPLKSLIMASSTDHGFLGRGFDPHHPQ